MSILVRGRTDKTLKQQHKNDSKPRIIRFMDRFNHFITVAGAERVGDKRSHVLRRGVWLILITMAILFLLLHLYRRISYFQSDPTFTRITNVQHRTLPFPGITLCGIKPDLVLKTTCHRKTTHVEPDELVPCHLNKEVQESALLKRSGINETGIMVCKRWNFGKYQQRASRTSATDCIVIEIETSIPMFMGELWLTPFPDDAREAIVINDVVNIFEGEVIYISVSAKNVTEIRDCDNSKLAHSEKYSRKGCIAGCVSKQIEKKCGCGYVFNFNLTKFQIRMLPFSYYNYYPMKNEGTECKTVPQQDCFKREWERQNQLASNCKCRKHCNQVSIEPMIRPHRIESRTLSRVYIYYRSFSVLTLEEKRQYDALGMLSDLGGTMGIFLGGCIFTLLQIIDAIISTGLSIINKQTTKEKTEDKKEKNKAYNAQTCKIEPLSTSVCALPIRANSMFKVPKNPIKKHNSTETMGLEEDAVNITDSKTASTNKKKKGKKKKMSLKKLHVNLGANKGYSLPSVSN